MNDQVRGLWARVKLQAHAEPLQLVSLPAGRLAEAAALFATEILPYCGLLREPGGLSLTISARTWLANETRFPEARAAGPYRAITLDLEVDPAVVGFIAPAAARMAAIGVSIVPQCGYLRDHLLVPLADTEKALVALQDLIRDCGLPA